MYHGPVTVCACVTDVLVHEMMMRTEVGIAHEHKHVGHCQQQKQHDGRKYGTRFKSEKVHNRKMLVL